MPNFKMIGPVVSEVIRDKHINTHTHTRNIYIDSNVNNYMLNNFFQCENTLMMARLLHIFYVVCAN